MLERLVGLNYGISINLYLIEVNGLADNRNPKNTIGE